LFWQVFLWACGGFYLRDRERDEFAWLSELTGVPVQEVPRALTVFDTLFPIKGSWLKDAYSSQCRFVMLVPTPMQGIGAYHRRRRHGLEDFEGLGYGDFTIRDLVKWNNAGVDWLARHSHLKASDGGRA